MATHEERLAELGIQLPDVVPPVAAYVPAIVDGSLVYTAGQLSMVSGALPLTGKVGDGHGLVPADDARDLARTATLNAQQALMLHKTRRTSDYVARTQALTDLQEALDLAEAPLRIECFDVSHLSGTNVVASMVVFEDGLPRKDQYRSFGVGETTDDTD